MCSPRRAVLWSLRLSFVYSHCLLLLADVRAGAEALPARCCPLQVTQTLVAIKVYCFELKESDCLHFSVVNFVFFSKLDFFLCVSLKL